MAHESDPTHRTEVIDGDNLDSEPNSLCAYEDLTALFHERRLNMPVGRAINYSDTRFQLRSQGEPTNVTYLANVTQDLTKRTRRDPGGLNMGLLNQGLYNLVHKEVI